MRFRLYLDAVFGALLWASGVLVGLGLGLRRRRREVPEIPVFVDSGEGETTVIISRPRLAWLRRRGR